MIKNILMISSLAALTTLAACGDEGKDSGDTSTSTTTGTTTTTTTGTTVPDLAIELVEYPSCDGSDVLSYYAETLGWTDGNSIVNAWETDSPDGWNDEHTMESIDFDEFGGWDNIERTLTTGADVASWTPDTSTVFTCDTATSDAMTYAIRVYDLDGNLGDCAMFSDHVDGIADVLGGMGPDYTAVTDEAEITAANCAEWAVSR